MAAMSPQASFLATRRGKLTLALLAAVAFLDFVDASIVNVALPSIRSDLGFSEQALQWVPSTYLLATHTPPAEALTAGLQRALLASSIFLLAAAAVALRATNTRGEQQRPSVEVPEPAAA